MIYARVEGIGRIQRFMELCQIRLRLVEMADIVLRRILCADTMVSASSFVNHQYGVLTVAKRHVKDFPMHVLATDGRT